MQEFVNLVIKSSNNNKNELENYVRTAGYNSINEFQNHLNDKSNEELVKGLVTIGGAVLLAYGISKLMEK